MRSALLVGLGGFAGSVCRYWLGGAVHRFAGAAFPWGTLAVNLLGCFVIGWLAGLAELRGVLSAELRLLLLVGFLGGFTTFSSFGWETFSLLRGGELWKAGANAGLHLVTGLLAVWLGHGLARLEG
ncbi:MAG TPA: fluoride efflux transporter CrcB [Thermoanaerobaculia bacterium]|nr:fluoride efflux transporter CrcB [Thermoanaerobaculia bacterium]